MAPAGEDGGGAGMNSIDMLREAGCTLVVSEDVPVNTIFVVREFCPEWDEIMAFIRVGPDDDEGDE